MFLKCVHPTLKKSTSISEITNEKESSSLSPSLVNRNMLTSGHLPFGDEEQPEQAPFTGGIP